MHIVEICRNKISVHDNVFGSMARCEAVLLYLVNHVMMLDGKASSLKK